MSVDSDRRPDGVLTITLNRPAHSNAIDVNMALALDALLQAVATDAAVRVVLLRGAGDHFSSGLDNVDFGNTALHGEQALRAAQAALERSAARSVRVLPQPVIALVQGVCAGVATSLVEACDIVLCADDARFFLPDAWAAQALSVTGAKALSRVMAPRAASFHALTGLALDGVQAARCGLATLSVAPAELEREVQALAADLLAKDPLALQFTKETLRHVGSMDWDAVLNFNAAKFAELKALQAGRPSPRAAAVESFLAGKSKPGLGR